MYRTEDDLATGAAATNLGAVTDPPHAGEPRDLERIDGAKRAVDVFFAVAFLLVFWWLFALIWVLTAATQGVPVVYRHKRVGRNGVEFDCLKFRTMIRDSDRVLKEHLASCPEARLEWERDFKLTNDPRVTRLGRFLRKTSLDELPQFFNVLVGDMSMVGPRPVIRAELERYYGQAAVEYKKVRPGLTGPWQVSGRHIHGYDDRVAMDVAYVRSATALGDLKILAHTFWVVLIGKGSK